MGDQPENQQEPFKAEGHIASEIQEKLGTIFPPY